MPSRLDEPLPLVGRSERPSRYDELVARERRLEPPPGTEERLWTALERRLAAAPAATKAPIDPGAAITPLKALVGLALVVATGAALLSAGGEPGERPRPTAAPVARPEPPLVATPSAPTAESALVGPAAAPPPAIESPAAPASNTVTSTDAPTRPDGSAARSARRAAKRSSSGAAVVAPAPAAGLDSDPFAAELQLIGEIRGALRRHAYRDLLRFVDDHERRFGATGHFVQERFVYQIEALCALGRAQEARQAATSLFERWPGSPHRTRVVRTCVGHE